LLTCKASLGAEARGTDCFLPDSIQICHRAAILGSHPRAGTIRRFHHAFWRGNRKARLNFRSFGVQTSGEEIARANWIKQWQSLPHCDSLAYKVDWPAAKYWDYRIGPRPAVLRFIIKTYSACSSPHREQANALY
jgi:hypothetical protein